MLYLIISCSRKMSEVFIGSHEDTLSSTVLVICKEFESAEIDEDKETKVCLNVFNML